LLYQIHIILNIKPAQQHPKIHVKKEERYFTLKDVILYVLLYFVKCQYILDDIYYVTFL